MFHEAWPLVTDLGRSQNDFFNLHWNFSSASAHDFVKVSLLRSDLAILLGYSLTGIH